MRDETKVLVVFVVVVLAMFFRDVLVRTWHELRVSLYMRQVRINPPSVVTAIADHVRFHAAYCRSCCAPVEVAHGKCLDPSVPKWMEWASPKIEIERCPDCNAVMCPSCLQAAWREERAGRDVEPPPVAPT